MSLLTVDLACEKYGNKQVWSDQGRIYIRIASEAFPRRLWSLQDVAYIVFCFVFSIGISTVYIVLISR